MRPIAALGDGAVVDIGGPTPYVEFQQFFDADYPAHTMRYYWKSSFADELTDARIDALVEAFGRRPSHHSTIDIWANLAARSRASPRDDSAFGAARRGVADQPGVELGVGRRTTRRTSPGGATSSTAVGGSAYLNFPGLLEEGEPQAKASHGATFERLAGSRPRGTRERVPLQREHRAGAGLSGRRRSGDGELELGDEVGRAIDEVAGRDAGARPPRRTGGTAIRSGPAGRARRP